MAGRKTTRKVSSPKGGRPSILTEKLADAICERIASGETLMAICREQGMPTMTTVMRWAQSDETGGVAWFRERYARAKELRLEVMAEEINGIADDKSEDPQSRRVRIDSRKWLLGKLAWRVYGDRSQVELTGKDGGAIEVSVAETLRAKRAERLKALSGDQA